MAVEIAHDPAARVAIMWDNTVDFAFGPVFSGPGADVEVQEFLDWLRENGPVDGAERTGSWVTGGYAAGVDPRDYTPAGLALAVLRWRHREEVEEA